MPATEKTWRDQKLLHVFFGFSGLALLVSTVWMLAADHQREWKHYQRKARDIELRLTDWRKLEQQTADRQAESEQLETALARQQLQPPDNGLYDQFKNEIGRYAEQTDRPATDFGRLDTAYAKLQELGAEAEAKVASLDEALRAAQAAWTQVGAAGKRLEQLTGADKEAAAPELKDAKAAAEAADLVASEREAEVESATSAVAAARDRFLEGLGKLLKKAKDHETDLATRRKFRMADYDAAKAAVDLAVRDGREEEMPRLQQQIDEIKTGEGGVDELTLWAQAASEHRDRLQGILRDLTRAEEDIEKRLADSRSELDRLEKAYEERRSTYFRKSLWPFGKKWLELPILDAFNSPLKIDNLWTQNLTIVNGSFGEVRRFDRCTTCHRNVETTMPGAADVPLFPSQHDIELVLQTPPDRPVMVDEENQPRPLDEVVAESYGVRFASYGLVDDDEVTVNYVQPLSLGATATLLRGEAFTDGLQVGDVILAINGDPIHTAQKARQYLIDGVTWDSSVTLTVLRGVPEPFNSHPRLDLFVGSLSPHKLAVFGCTSCHEGQGSATSFKWASHTPNSPEQADRWSREHGWFLNHHWIFPMYPKRFAESACLKCHHQVTELEASERFPDAPAPKLVKGYQLVGKYGCYGCHEIHGYDGPDRRVGPDLRLEPNYSPAAAAVTADPNFANTSLEVQEWTETLVQKPYETDARHKLRDFLLADAAGDKPQVSHRSHQMAEVLQDQEIPGTRRKVGPSLRYVAEKLGKPFLVDWIREPKHFRPSTQMPQFFGQWKHLQSDPGELEKTQRYERVEILGIANYLLANSEPFSLLPQVEGVEPPTAERGQIAFETRGCLACHQHDDFPAAKSDFGPNLTGLSDKFGGASGSPGGAAWLYSWLKQPSHYNPRTKMPNLYLEPVKEADGTVTDPAADIVAYLLSPANSRDWQPAAESLAALELDPNTLDALVKEYLQGSFSIRRAEEYLAAGIPEGMQSVLKGAEIELVGEIDHEKKLRYVGSKSIVRYGCHGCHDIPGFEAAKPIGTAIADWGRKETSKLAFEHILEYVHSGEHPAPHGGEDAAQEAAHAPGPMTTHAEDSFDDSFYTEELAAQERSGFIWQKLTEPRSYDYKKTANKKYTDRLRMPLFPLTPPQREAVVTFMLGLVADPPAPEFVYQGDERQQALNHGQVVLEKFNCAGCHVLEAERWQVAYQPGEFRSPPEVADYTFLEPEIPAETLLSSATPDAKTGLLRAIVEGLPAISNEDARQEIWDEEGDPIELDEIDEYDPKTLLYPFELWKPATLEGQVYNVGVMRLPIPAATIEKQWPAKGGDLTMLLLPRVLELEKQSNPSANGTEAWGWLPPPLMGEGREVQPGWLHSFLLEPFPIRPATFLRMPKFTMSPQDATELVNYFAAKDRADFPFTFAPEQTYVHLEQKQRAFAEQTGVEGGRLEHAMQIVTDGNYCVKCHLIGDYVPEGSVRAQAPHLSDVQNRLHADYIRKWIANPKRLLPYTSMPVNLPFDPNSPHLGGVSQALFPGNSIEQVDALVDLLMNYGHFTDRQVDVRQLVKAAAEAAGSAAGSEEVDETTGVSSETRGALKTTATHAHSSTSVTLATSSGGVDDP